VPLPLSLATSQELLQHKVAELYWRVAAKVQEQLAQEFTRAFEEIDHAIDKALVIPLIQSGASTEEVAAVVRQATIVKEAVKEPLWQRIDNFLRENRELRDARAKYAAHHNRIHTSTPLEEPPVVAPAWEGQLPELPTERRMVLLDKV
jgi:uncharacterized membrane protein YheB (UPF0754 family)